jgi:hypothetical protein
MNQLPQIDAPTEEPTTQATTDTPTTEPTATSQTSQPASQQPANRYLTANCLTQPLSRLQANIPTPSNLQRSSRYVDIHRALVKLTCELAGRFKANIVVTGDIGELGREVPVGCDGTILIPSIWIFIATYSVVALENRSYLQERSLLMQ